MFQKKLILLFFICCLSTNALANPRFEQLSCNGIFENVNLVREYDQIQVTFKRNSASPVAFIQSLLPQLPEKLIKAYRCQEITFTLPTSLCVTHPSLSEVFQCDGEAPVELTLRLKSTCYDNDEWDVFSFQFSSIQFHSRHDKWGADTSLKFEVEFGNSESSKAHSFESQEFIIQKYVLESTLREPECRMDGRFFYRPARATR